ncbi:MAG: hypothetical protein NTU45_02550, partial [Planctomycetota bacterium]|nr:hypothetical protein [Planctomycetota bacterium]
AEHSERRLLTFVLAWKRRVERESVRMVLFLTAVLSLCRSAGVRAVVRGLSIRAVDRGCRSGLSLAAADKVGIHHTEFRVFDTHFEADC